MSDGSPPLDRRALLRAALGLGLLPWMAACDGSPRSVDAGADGAPDADATDAEADAGAFDARLVGDAGPAVDAAFVRGPWLQLGGPGEVHFRVEVFTGAPEPRLTVDGANVILDATEADITWFWPPAPVIADADLAGRYTLYQATLSNLRAGQMVNWRCKGGFGTAMGRVQVAGELNTFRVAWVADTMWPRGEKVAATLAAQAPALVLHGGDVQYRTNPGDTYNGFFRIWGPLLKQAPINFCLGNHEYESGEEFGDFYARLFARQGTPGPGGTPFVLQAGSVRFLMLDSEQLGFGEASPQLPWLETTLAGLRDDPAVLQVVVCFHRPGYTFGKTGADRDTRDRLHAILRDAGVRLVLNGHNHSYERFNVDGLTYVVDGGGGALLTDPDEDLPNVRAEHPEEEALRVAVSKSHGGLLLDFDTDGAVAARRLNDDGGETDRFLVPSWRQ